MIALEIKEYLTKLEGSRLDIDKLCDTYENYVQYRSTSKWEEMADIGFRMWTETLERGVYGHSETQHSWINVTWEKLEKKISRLIASDIYLTLEKANNVKVQPQKMLENNINWAFDYFYILRKTDLALYYKFFTGFGCVKIGWDKYDTRDDWETGIPTCRVVDSRALFITPNITQDHFDDIDRVFEIVTYNQEAFFNKLKNSGQISTKKASELIDKIAGNKEKNSMRKGSSPTNRTNEELIDVVYCQYKKPEYTTVRKIKDFAGENNPVYDVLESDLEEYVGAENMDKVGDRDDDTAIPEGFEAGVKQHVKYDVWYEVMFVPALRLLIYPPLCIGNRCKYVFYTGLKNPDSSYPISDAYKQAQPQDLMNKVLTMHLITAIRKHRSIPAYIKEGIKNFQYFIENYEEQDVELQIDADWARKNPGVIPFQYVVPPQSSPDLKELIAQLERWIGEGTSSTPILAGQGKSHMSGAAINSLTNNALDSSKSDFNPYQLFLQLIGEIVKEMIAENKRYPHVDNYLSMPFEVNTNSDTSMLLIAPKLRVEVKDEAGEEESKQIRAEKMERLYDKGIVPLELALPEMDAGNPEEILSLKQQQDPIYNMVKTLEDRPDLINLMIQFVENERAKEQQGAAPDSQPAENLQPGGQNAATA